MENTLPTKISKDSLSGYSKLLQTLLRNRGIYTQDQAKKFLHPTYEYHDPFSLKDMDKAADRIINAIERNEKIVVYGDYDADGIPAGVIIHDFFKKIGYLNFDNYFPHRFEEGYGLNLEAIEQFGKNGVNIIITLDCGIADVLQVDRANELGIDVIVTDHHQPQDILPKAFAIINPKQNDCPYPCKVLCGSGVAFKLVQAILAKKRYGIKEGLEKWLLDMVGLATISDMVPLVGENRVFAYYGLKVLQKSPRPGLQAMLRLCNTKQTYLTEDDIGFTVTPRINAASRMGAPHDAFRLLVASNELEAEDAAAHLHKINDERKGMVAFLVKEVKKKLLEKIDSGLKKVIVIGNPNWKPALLGPVANNIVESHKAPVFLWGRADGDTVKGSCRSDGSVDLVELMKTSNIMNTFGGHRLSGGFSVLNDKIHFLEEALNDAYKKIAPLESDEGEKKEIDAEITLDEINWNTYSDIEKLAPFGMGNSKPLFAFKAVRPYSVRTFGKEKNHLELTFRNSMGDKISAIAFFASTDSYNTCPEPGKAIDLLANIEKSVFKSYPELRLRIVDIL